MNRTYTYNRMLFKKVFRFRTLNADHFIILLSSIVAAVFCLVIYFGTNRFYGSVFNEVQNRYNESVDIIVENFHQLINQKMKDDNSLLQSWYDKDIFRNGSSEEIQKYLTSHTYKMTENFHDVFYFDKAGNAYSVYGTVVPVPDRDYYSAIFNDKKKFYISCGVNSRVTKAPIYIIANPVYDSQGKLKGALCASIENFTITRLFRNISGASFGQISVIDGDGKFISNPDPDLIYKTFTPEDSKYEPSSVFVNSHSDGEPFLSVSPEDGQQVLIVLKSIEGSNWKIALYLPYAQVQKIDRRRTLLEAAIILIALACLVILVFVEYKLMHYFEKNRLIEANYDPVTCIFTRKKFETEGLKMIQKRKGSSFFLLETDIRGFKFINQTYGEDTANKILADFAEYTCDFANYFNGVCGRGYADHFYTLFPVVTTQENGLEAFKETLGEIDRHFGMYDIKIRPKFGIAMGKYDGSESARVFFRQLISNAALAKSTIECNLQETFAVCNEALAEKNRRLHILENSVEQALQNHDFFVMYQPKTNLETGKISGAEALCRWNHPDLGIVPPDEFIPLFEKNGYVTKVDFYVYEEVFKFLDERIRQGKPVVPVSVNMSRNHNNPEKFMKEFLELFHKYNIPERYVQVEILERSYTSNDVLADVTRLLHAHGFSVAMDDFGSGESSLNMLTKVPVDTLKFDRAFLLSATDENGKIIPEDAVFIEGLMDMSRKLNKETVFEGVETAAQNDFLKQIRCQNIQGYFYSKPLSESDFVTYLEAHI